MTFRIKKKKIKSQSLKVPWKLLLLGGNETFLANKETVSCQLPVQLPNSLSSISFDTRWLLLTVTVSAQGRSHQIYLRDGTETSPPPQNPSVCKCVCKRMGGCRRTGRGQTRAAPLAASCR